jgi:hypothetical protein
MSVNFDMRPGAPAWWVRAFGREVALYPPPSPFGQSPSPFRGGFLGSKGPWPLAAGGSLFLP